MLVEAMWRKIQIVDCQSCIIFRAGNEKIPWNDLPERCVLKANHWSGDSLFILDNGKEPLPNVPSSKIAHD